MRAAAIQMRSGVERQANLDAAEALIREAASNGATFVSTPEMTTLLDQNRKRMMATLEERDPDPEDFFCALSSELGIAIHVGSMPVIAEGGERLRNRALLIDDGKLIATYDKVHLFDADVPGESWKESKAYEHGEEAVVARVREAVVGLSVCFDLRFPALYGQLARAGAEVLAVPSAFTVPTGSAHWEVLLRARAIETGSYVIAAAQGGEHEDGRVTYGHSMIVSPWGDILDEVANDEPGIAYADLDMAKVRDMRQRIPTLTLARQPQLRTFGV